MKADPGRVIDPDEDLIHHLSYGYLIVPSENLMDIVYRCETVILNILEKSGLSVNIIFEGKEQINGTHTNTIQIGIKCITRE